MGCFGYICPVCNTQIVGGGFATVNEGGGELCRMKHVRAGKVVGETVGHYDEYGGVVEDLTFRNDDGDINSHTEICTSEFGREDSFYHGYIKLLPSGATIRADRFNLEYLSSSTCPEYEVVKYISDSIGIDSRAVDYANRIIQAMVKYDEFLKTGEFKKIGDPHYDTLEWHAHDKFRDVRMLVNYPTSDDYEVFMEAVWDLLNALPVVQGKSGIIAVHEKCYQSLSAEEQEKLPFSPNDPDQSWGEVREEFV